jgi:hypothetical protein
MVDQSGKVTFIAAQTFPHTIAGVKAGTDLTGGGNRGKITLNLDTTKVPQLNSVNTFTGNQGVIGSVTVTGSVGVGTASPATSLDIFSGTTGVHAPIARFGSNGGNDCNSILTYTGSGNAEIFEAGVAGCFMPGAVTGDGGLRVSPGNRILLGDNDAYRVLIDDVGNVEQKRTAGGMVKRRFISVRSTAAGLSPVSIPLSLERPLQHLLADSPSISLVQATTFLILGLRLTTACTLPRLARSPTAA